MKVFLHPTVVDDSLQSLYIRIKKLVDSLLRLRDLFQQGVVDPVLLSEHQQELHAIEDECVDGNFVNAQGNIPKGQATLVKYMDSAYDLVHECLILQDAACPSKAEEGRIEAAIHTRESLLSVPKKMNQVSSSAFELLMEPLAESVHAVKDIASNASSRLKSIISSSLGYSREIAHRLEPVDVSLQPIHDRLLGIKARLRRIRYERNKVWVSSLGKDGSELKDFSEALTDRLSALEDGLKEIEKSKVSGQFINDKGVAAEGQLVLRALFDECWVLLIELMDDNCIFSM